jgi:hypothetical protein
MTETKKQGAVKPRTARRKGQEQRKKRWVLPVLLGVGSLLLIAAAVLALGQKPGPANLEAGEAPLLAVDREKVDLGDMKFDQPAEVSFEITNTGADTLQFLEQPYIEVKEGC